MGCGGGLSVDVVLKGHNRENFRDARLVNSLWQML